MKSKYAVLVFVLLSSGVARTQELDSIEQKAPDATRQAVRDGAFSGLTMPARVGSTRAFAWGFGGYDSTRSGAIFDSAAEVALWGPVALRGGATYSNDTNRMRPSVGARVQLLRQDRHGIDGSVSIFFKTEGFTEGEGEIETFASIGKTFEEFSLVGNLVYGQDPEGNERDGELRAMIFHTRGRFSLGVDGRARFAIGTQHGKAASVEPKFDATGGPLATVVLGAFALFAEVGPSALSLGGGTKVGVSGFGGVGSTF